MRNKFNILIFLIAYYKERLHRYLFDNVFISGYKNTNKDNWLIRLDKYSYYLCIDYRPYMKRWVPVLKRAYRRKKIQSIYAFIAWRLIYDKGYERYTGYDAFNLKR